MERLPVHGWHFGPSPDAAMRRLVFYKSLKTGKFYGDPWLRHTRSYSFGFIVVEAYYREHSPDPL